MREQEIESISATTAMPPHERAQAPPRPGGEPGAPRAGASRLGVLRHRDYRNVWLGSMISNVGTWMEGVGLQWLVAKQTGDMVVMGYLAAAQLGPTLVLGVIGGLVADRFNRKRLLVVTQVLMMLVAGGLALTSYLGMATPGVLILLALLQGLAMAFNIPAWQVLTPRLVPRAELAKAIALNSLQFNVGRVVGPALAGVLIEKIGATGLFAINTVSFLAVIVAVSLTPDAPAPLGARDGGLAGAWRQTREAFAFVFTRRGPLAVFVGLVLFSVLGGPLLRMLPLFVSEVYKADAKAYGLLLSLMGVGAVAGALGLRLVPRWYPRHHFIPLAIMGGGISMTAFSAVPSLTLACVLMLLVGLFWIWSFSSSIAAMQLLVDDGMRGRVMSLTNTAVFGAMPLGALLSGVIGESVERAAGAGAHAGLGVQVGTGALSLVLTVAGLVMLTWRTPEVDGIRPGEPGHERQPGLFRGITAGAHRPPTEAGAAWEGPPAEWP